MAPILEECLLDRMVSAVEQVRERLSRATQALGRADVPHAVLGGNAVFLWMVRHGEGGERFTPNVDLLVNRADAATIRAALEGAGFCAEPERPDLFRDGPSGSPRTRLRLLFAGEKVREADLLANPDVGDSEHMEGFQVLALPALAQVKLTAFRTIDQVHLSDMLEVGLIDETWKTRYPPELAERLQLLLDTPEG